MVSFLEPLHSILEGPYDAGIPVHTDGMSIVENANRQGRNNMGQ